MLLSRRSIFHFKLIISSSTKGTIVDLKKTSISSPVGNLNEKVLTIIFKVFLNLTETELRLLSDTPLVPIPHNPN